MGSENISTELWVMLTIMLLLLLGISIAAVSYNLRLHTKLVNQFRQLGEKFELELTVPPATMWGIYRRNPTLYGRYQGHEMSIYPKGYGLDNTRQTDIAVRISTLGNAKLHMTVARRNMTGKMGQIGRLKEVKTDDRAFDEAFSLRSNAPDEAKNIFTPEWRARMTAEWPKSESFLTLQDGMITHLRFGLPYDDASRKEIEEMVVFCAALSESL